MGMLMEDAAAASRSWVITRHLTQLSSTKTKTKEHRMDNNVTPIVNENCFSAPNPSSYTLSEIWPPSSSSSLPNPSNHNNNLAAQLAADVTTTSNDDKSSLTHHSRGNNKRLKDRTEVGHVVSSCLSVCLVT